jgi:DNA invertase Pin-like site-specific DNA recombinase
VGYVRVSTTEQNTARQEFLMESLGVEKIYIEKISGKSKDRPKLQEMMTFVREGDTVIVESISRFARNVRDLLDLVEQLKEKKVDFVSKKENIDTTTPAGKLMLTVFGALAEFERESLLQRQREGIEIAKAEGKYKGRKPIEIDEKLFEELYRQWKNGDTQPKYMIKKLGLSRNTFYRRVKAYEEKHGIIKSEK